MRPSLLRRSIFFMALFWVWGSPGTSWTASAFSLQPESKLWLVGDSTLHPFTSQATELRLTSELDPSAFCSSPACIDGVLHKGTLKAMDVVVPVQKLKSHESGLDKNMYKALKADVNPEIVFHLSRYDVSPGATGSSHVKALGSLQIAGREQPVEIEGEVTTEDGSLRVQGQYALLMTDYGIKPPTMMMGAIRVKDRVVIHYDLQLR